MKTYVEVYHNVDGGKASEISEKLKEMGFTASMGEHDQVYNWKEDVTTPMVIDFIDRVQNKLKGTGAMLHFTTTR